MRLLARDAGGPPKAVWCQSQVQSWIQVETDSAFGFGSEPSGVDELIREGAVEGSALPLVWGRYGRVGRCAIARLANSSANAPEQKFAPVVVEDLVNSHVVGPERILCSPSEPPPNATHLPSKSREQNHQLL